MFQATRRRLALWYTAVTAILLFLFATGFYWYVRSTLVERIDDTLNHVVEVVQRSLVIEPFEASFNLSKESSKESLGYPAYTVRNPAPLRVNIEASFHPNADAVEDDHIDLEWFNPAGALVWSTFVTPPEIPLHLNPNGETVRLDADQLLRQVTQRVMVAQQVLGYLRVSHPWFEVTKPSRQLLRDLALGLVLVVSAVGAIGWFLSGLAIAPVRDSYQRLKQFTADASHELRNPIAVIQTNVQVALADPDPVLQQAQLRVIERLTRRLGRLVNDLLFLARQDSGMTPLQLERVDLQNLLFEVVEEQQAIAVEKGLTVTCKTIDSSPGRERTLGSHLGSHLSSALNTSPPPDSENSPPSNLYQLQADRNQLSRLFTNLISNAVQYSSVGSIDVILYRIKQQHSTLLQVQIQDNGIGIPAEALSQIFDRFYRVDSVRTTLGTTVQSSPQATSGSGLGLAIAKVIVDNHHGQIQVESKPQQGTIFTVSLPTQSDLAG